MWSCRLLQCCESTAEERSAANPHATFCGSRRRATASGDPVGWETERCRMAQATAPILDSTLGTLTDSGRTSAAEGILLQKSKIEQPKKSRETCRKSWSG